MKKIRAVTRTTLCLLSLTGGSVYGQDSSSVDTGRPEGVERATWRFKFDNDLFVDKDNKISHGWSLHKHAAVADSWESLRGLPGFIRRWGENIPTLTDYGLFYRAGIAIGQIIQTPDDFSRSDLIEDDVPYAGAFTLQTTWYAFNDDEFRGFEVVAGVVGPLSQAEQFQKTGHKLFDNKEFKGWDNQLDTEPLLNLNYMRKQKIWRQGHAFDMAINGDLGLGNLFTQASVALEMRFGHNMPRGFVHGPDPIGLSMHHMASLNPANPGEASFYATLVLRGSAVAHNIFLDGNLCRDSHSVEKEPLFGLAVAGLHYERNNWGIHCSVMTSTDDVDTSESLAAEGGERLGSIDVEWRF